MHNASNVASPNVLLFFCDKICGCRIFFSFCVDVGLIVYRASAIRREKFKKFINNRAILRIYCEHLLLIVDVFIYSRLTHNLK